MASLTAEGVLEAIQACFCTLLGNSVADCCVTAGPPAIVNCCAGFAWVRLVGAYPTTNFPSHANQPQNCLVSTFALQVEIGVMRCAPGACNSTGAVCCESYAEANALLMADFAVIRQLFACGCTGIDGRDIIVGQTIVDGPQGGCMGIKTTVTIRSEN